MNFEEVNQQPIQDSFDDFVDDIIEYDPDYNVENVVEGKKTVVYNFNDIAEVISAFRCKYCNFIDNSIKSMIQHYQNHMSPKERIEQLKENETIEILVCSICYEQHKNLESLKEHMMSSHGYTPPQQNSEGKYKCDKIKCSNAGESKEFDKSDEKIMIPPVPFKDFKTRLKQSLTYKCPLKGCCYKFETKEKQEQHIKCHISTKIENVKSFKCLECGKESKCWRECTDHMWKAHKIDVDLFSCPICSFKAIFSIKVWRHMKSHPKWKSKVLRSTHHWNINKERNNSVTNRWYSPKICEVCSRPFSNSKTLSKHVKAVHNKIKPFICNVCGRKSARKSTWVIHMRQHTGEKPYKCKICSYRASDPSVLRTHEKRHTKEATYKCKSCEYTSIQPSGLKLHLKVNHPEDYKQLQCDQCNYISVSVGMLEFHKKDHKKGLISNEDSQEASRAASIKIPQKLKQPDKSTGNVEISSDCFLPLESTDSLAPDPCLDTGGVTIPANSEDTQFPFIGN